MLQPLIPKWRRLAETHPEIYKDGVWVSWDNAKFHKEGGVLNRARGLRWHRLPCPALSHDMHKVVEHAINTLKAAANKWANDHPEVRDQQGVQEAFKRLFFERVSLEGVRKDIMSLRSTYRVIARGRAAGGVAGGWPAKRYRCAMPPT